MISYVQLGTVPYSLGLELQRKLVDARRAGAIGDVLLLLEHPAVITLGKNADPKNVLASREQLGAKGVELFECDRGGDVTYHGPGQLVGYPVFDLRTAGRDPEGRPATIWPVDFMRKLEEVLIRGLGQALLREDTGFHSFQIYEAAVRQYRHFAGRPEGDHILLGATRFLTAHAPTVRATNQTFEIAARLSRGEALAAE